MRRYNVLAQQGENANQRAEVESPLPTPCPPNLVMKCNSCKELLYFRILEKNGKVCPTCNYHFRLTACERIALLVDPGSFVEYDAGMVSTDPLSFANESQNYAQKLLVERTKTSQYDAIVSGYASIGGTFLALAVMDFHFIGGSMGVVVGEKIVRTVERALERKWPVLIISASGGARMQEGLFSLMQMAKTSAALARLGEAGLPYISLLTDPTTGGTTASFALLGDVILAEQGSLICFAGPRVVEQFMHTKLPPGALTAEFALQHGMIDATIHRHDLRKELARLLRFFVPVPSICAPLHCSLEENSEENKPVLLTADA